MARKWHLSHLLCSGVYWNSVQMIPNSQFKPNFSESVYMCIYHTNLSSPSLGSWLYHFIDIYPTASGSVVKKPPDNARDMSLIRGLGRSPGEGNGNPLQYSCLGNFVDRWAWQPTVHGVIKSQTRLSN